VNASRLISFLLSGGNTAGQGMFIFFGIDLNGFKEMLMVLAIWVNCFKKSLTISNVYVGYVTIP
jgi:hypothetical protein